MSFHEKYLKYKNKYISLKNMTGGAAGDNYETMDRLKNAQGNLVKTKTDINTAIIQINQSLDNLQKDIEFAFNNEFNKIGRTDEELVKYAVNNTHLTEKDALKFIELLKITKTDITYGDLLAYKTP